MALEYESNPNLVGAIKAPLGVLGADKNYRQALYETIAEQVEGLGRRPNANYNVGEVVYPSSNLQYALTCTTAGTSGATDLDISANTEGDTITDGTVVWKVVKRNYLGSDGVLPIANGGTGATTPEQARENLELGNMALKDNAIANATISGKVITLTFADGTTKTLTTQDTAPARYITSKSGNANSWLVEYNDGWLEQGGRLNANYNATVTYKKAFAVTPTLLVSTKASGGAVGQNRHCVQSESATGFTVGDYHETYSATKSWYACGYGA